VEIARSAEKTGVAVLTWQRVQPTQVSSQSMKFTIPDSWAMGAYVCHVVSGEAKSLKASEAVTLNAPDPWWLQGDGGCTEASPGGWLRIFGKSLHFDSPSQVRLESAGKKIVLAVRETKDTGGYALAVAVPTDLPAGNYAVAVHNGFGGPEAWSAAGHVQIHLAPQWNQEVFDVSKFVAAGGGSVAGDCTVAVKAALAKAAANGGGIVYFPRGRYLINEELIVPRFVTLKGEGQGLVSLYWPQRDTALASLITGTDDFAVEDLAIYTNGIHRYAISGRNKMRVQRVRIRADIYYRHDFVGKAHAVKPVEVPSTSGGAGVKISGDNVLMTDCDVYHSCSAIEMYHTRGGLIARNRFDYGASPMQIYGLSRVIIEDNEFAGAALWASGIGVSLYHEACASYHIYYAHNRTRQTYGGDREAVTTDGHGTAYIGKVAAVTGCKLTLAEFPWWGSAHKDMIPFKDFQRGIERKRPQNEYSAEEWHGITLYILDGRGAGQYRNVLECEGKQVTLDKPWTVPPDATSIVSIGKFMGRMLFIGNEFRDAGTSIQLYPPNCDSIVAENQLWRVESTNCGAELSHRLLSPTPSAGQRPDAWRVEPSWFNQFLNNHIWEGNGWAGGSSVLGVHAYGHVLETGDAGFNGLPISRGHVVRGNQLDNNANILVEGSVRDVIVEHNAVRNAEQGVVLRASRSHASGTDLTPPDGVFIGENTFQNVGDPVVKP